MPLHVSFVHKKVQKIIVLLPTFSVTGLSKRNSCRRPAKDVIAGNRSGKGIMLRMENSARPITMLFVYLTDKRTGRYEMEQEVTELWNLVESMGDTGVADLIIQKGLPFRETYVGPGKAAEIGEYLKTHKVEVVTFNGMLTSGQKFNLTKMYWDINPSIQVWDRVDLILEIFSRHAHTREAKLQIELARMRHMGPSIFGMGMVLSRQGGGIGTRGIGETNTELMKRHWKREMKRVTDSLTKLTDSRTRQIERRKSIGLKTVSLVGYTNAGKTTLFNLLTHKQKPVDNALFVTLDSAIGVIFIPELGKRIAVSDTIGFIKDLPPDLIDAFRSTLLESVHADAVLHVIDVSDRDYMEKADVVDGILSELGIPEENVIYVYNKTDAVPDLDRQQVADRTGGHPHVFVSAAKGQGIDDLLSALIPRVR
ncbi:GTPase HflX [Candidatus Gottesmanbacteria bacterium RBG_16_52_11]|uniref:GTPase HflX n=1 Tax=Candidatus Gottesmanbacteria bacterium RBG_16_52_11 TaxID=1798374 RepID=A0A1F5YX88_9BACT|nr:MAG: GTPase HflX [Candidatus Gottesmanbacteria bacterium RBG_16_52_11]